MNRTNFLVLGFVCALMSCSPNTAYRQWGPFDPFSADSNLLLSRSCPPDTTVAEAQKSLSIKTKLRGISGVREITGKPVSTYSRLAEFVLVASSLKDACGRGRLPLIIKVNQEIDSLWFYGTPVFVAKSNEYLEAFSGYRRCHTDLKMRKYRLRDALITFYYAPYLRGDPDYVVDVDRFTKFACGEERRKYRLYVAERNGEFRVDAFVRLHEHNTCCKWASPESPDTASVRADVKTK